MVMAVDAVLGPNPAQHVDMHHIMVPVITVTIKIEAEPITYLDLFNLHQVLSGLTVSIIAALQALHLCLHPAELPLQPLPLSCRLLHCLLPDLGYMRCICRRLPGHCLLQKHKEIVTTVLALAISSYCCCLQRLLPMVHVLHVTMIVIEQIVRVVAHCRRDRQLAMLLFLALLKSSDVLGPDKIQLQKWQPTQTVVAVRFMV